MQHPAFLSECGVFLWVRAGELFDDVVVLGEQVMPFTNEFVTAGGIEDVINPVFVTIDEIDLAAHRAHVADISPPADAFFIEGLIGQVHTGRVLADAPFFDVVHAPRMWANFFVAQITEDEAFVALFVLHGFDDFDARPRFTDIDEVEPGLIELIATYPVVLLDFGAVFAAFGFCFEEEVKKRRL